MAKNKGFDGHPNWNLWNVSLWVSNDEGLYHLARACINRCPNREIAARAMLDQLQMIGVRETPDGAPYTKTSIRHAMRGL